MGALLLAGLYFFRGHQVSKSPSIIKPSQLDFTKSNQIQEPMKVQASTPEADAVVPAPTSTLPPPSTLSESEQKLWTTFEEVLKSKNDSDSRVSTLKNLSADFRKALTDKYGSLKMEDRNARGFIVFLISKDLKSPSDLDFLQKVYQESPCLSLENCGSISRDDDPHNAGVNQTTLIYPQLVALYQLDKQLQSKPELLKDAEMRAGVLATLKQAEAFQVPSVRDQAEKIRQKYNL